MWKWIVLLVAWLAVPVIAVFASRDTAPLAGLLAFFLILPTAAFGLVDDD